MMKNIILLPFLFSAISIMSMEKGQMSPKGCESPILPHLTREQQKSLIRQRSQGLPSTKSDSKKKPTRESIKANLLKPFKKPSSASSSRSPSPTKTR
jgi:hypothetical protein